MENMQQLHYYLLYIQLLSIINIKVIVIIIKRRDKKVVIIPKNLHFVTRGGETKKSQNTII